MYRKKVLVNLMTCMLILIANKNFRAQIISSLPNAEVKYDSLIVAFKNGNSDSLFLRNLILVADLKHDKKISNPAVLRYLSSVKDSLAIDNLQLLAHITKDTKDASFYFVLRNLMLLWDTEASTGIIQNAINIVHKESTPRVFNKEGKTDFEKLEMEYVDRYSELGEISILQDIALFYYLKKDIYPFVKTKQKIRQKFPKSISAFDSNNDAWAVFQNSSDKDLLSVALNWSKKIIEHNPENIEAMDTYANLLYKIGNVKEAIEWEAKAVTINPNIPEINQNYKKMKEGKPTWD